MSDEAKENKSLTPQPTSTAITLPNSKAILLPDDRLNAVQKVLSQKIFIPIEKNVHLVGTPEQWIEETLATLEKILTHTNYPIKEDKKSSLPHIPPSLAKLNRVKQLRQNLAGVLIEIRRGFYSTDPKQQEPAKLNLSKISKALIAVHSDVQSLVNNEKAIEIHHRNFRKESNTTQDKLYHANHLVDAGYIEASFFEIIANAFKHETEHRDKIEQLAINLLSGTGIQQWLEQQAAEGSLPFNYLLSPFRTPGYPASIRGKITHLLRGLVVIGDKTTCDTLLQIFESSTESMAARDAACTALEASTAVHRQQLFQVLQRMLRNVPNDLLGGDIAMKTLQYFVWNDDEDALQLTIQQLSHELCSIRRRAANVLEEAPSFNEAMLTGLLANASTKEPHEWARFESFKALIKLITRFAGNKGAIISQAQAQLIDLLHAETSERVKGYLIIKLLSPEGSPQSYKIPESVLKALLVPAQTTDPEAVEPKYRMILPSQASPPVNTVPNSSSFNSSSRFDFSSASPPQPPTPQQPPAPHAQFLSSIPPGEGTKAETKDKTADEAEDRPDEANSQPKPSAPYPGCMTQ